MVDIGGGHAWIGKSLRCCSLYCNGLADIYIVFGCKNYLIGMPAWRWTTTGLPAQGASSSRGSARKRSMNPSVFNAQRFEYANFFLDDDISVGS